MIDLHTGSPGEGKTLYTLSTVEARRIKENRAVYYHGIKDLKLNWIELKDPTKWHECPAGAIIVLDECQQIFPPRANGAPIPLAESKLETHRHNGHDIILVTQDPTFLPSHLRKLVGTHKHMMRKFGSKWVTVHQFKGCRENVSKSRKDSIESQWVDDSSMYDKYKTAEVITQKLRVPWKVWGMFILPIIIVGGAWYFYNKRMTPAPVVNPEVSGKVGPIVVGGDGQTVQKKTYDLAAFAPRLEGLPHTAPRYDELTAPVRVPVVVGCVWFEKTQRGHCYTQQGTTLSPPPVFIKSFIERGMFEDFERGPSIAQSSDKRENESKSTPITRPIEKQSSGGARETGG